MLLAIAAPQALAQRGPDIVGLRLGMTEQVTVAALQAHAPSARISKTMRRYSYRDGVRQFSSPEHLHVLKAASSTGAQDIVTVVLSSGPAEQRVIGVDRLVELPAPPLVEQLLQEMGTAQKRGIAPRDLSQCGYALNAQLHGSPVCNQRVRMADFGAWSVADIEAAEWVGRLESEAVKARTAGGSGPKL